MKVFLSHNNRDKSLVREIRRNFPKHIKTWLDEDELLVGQDLNISIKSAIKEDADFVIIFLGKEAVKSEWVKRELAWALEREKEIKRVFVLPVLVEDVWNSVEPIEFQERLYLRCFDQSEEEIKMLSQKLSNQIFAWLSHHLDESKRKDLENKKETENTMQLLEKFEENIKSAATDIPDGWSENIRSLCIEMKEYSPEIQIERLTIKLERELKKWKEAEEKNKQSLENNDEPFSKFGMVMTAISNSRMIEMLETCYEEIQLWEKHKKEIEAKDVIKRIHKVLKI